jgi:hypothetical protein
MYALFNKDKVFIGFSSEIPHESFLGKEIPAEQRDLKTWRWEGDYETGKMVSINAGYPIEEIELEKMLFGYIEKKYPLAVQLNNIMNQLRKIVEKDDSLQDDDFMDMSDCIKNAVDKHNKRVNYYKNYSKIISKNESKQQFAKVFGQN